MQHILNTMRSKLKVIHIPSVALTVFKIRGSTVSTEKQTDLINPFYHAMFRNLQIIIYSWPVSIV